VIAVPAEPHRDLPRERELEAHEWPLGGRVGGLFGELPDPCPVDEPELADGASARR
jgi:hypothetical protein